VPVYTVRGTASYRRMGPSGPLGFSRVIALFKDIGRNSPVEEDYRDSAGRLP
jgi:hypothetical protein